MPRGRPKKKKVLEGPPFPPFERIDNIDQYGTKARREYHQKLFQKTRDRMKWIVKCRTWEELDQLMR